MPGPNTLADLRVLNGKVELVKNQKVITVEAEETTANRTHTIPAKTEDDVFVMSSDLDSSSNIENYLKSNETVKNLSYSYFKKTSDTLTVVYVYGDKCISYVLKVEGGDYYWITQVNISDIDADGKEDEATSTTVAGEVQEFAVRYRVTGSGSSPNWFPFHGTTPPYTTLDSYEFNIDGIVYANFASIPSGDYLFNKITVNQVIEARFVDTDIIPDMTVVINTVFDETHLHFENEYTIGKDLDVNRFVGSRFSLTPADTFTANTGVVYTNDLSNLAIPSADKPTSVIGINESINVIGANSINGIGRNIGQGTSFYNPDSNTTIFKRSNGTLTFYYNLCPFLDDGLFTAVVAGTTFSSGNNVIYLPISNGAGVDANIPLSAGLKLRFPSGAKTVKEVTTTTYTLEAADKDKILHFTDVAGCAVTVPPGLTAGNRYEGKQLGGQVTFVAGIDVALNTIATKTLATQAQYAVFGIDWLENDGTDDIYLVYGELELV